MSTFGAAVAAMRGEFDRFDAVSGYIDALVARLQHDTEEMVEVQLDRDTGSVIRDLNIVDHLLRVIEQLRAAGQQVDDICLLVQRVVAALPD